MESLGNFHDEFKPVENVTGFCLVVAKFFWENKFYEKHHIFKHSASNILRLSISFFAVYIQSHKCEEETIAYLLKLKNSAQNATHFDFNFNNNNNY